MYYALSLPSVELLAFLAAELLLVGFADGNMRSIWVEVGRWRRCLDHAADAAG